MARRQYPVRQLHALVIAEEQRYPLEPGYEYKVIDVSNMNLLTGEGAQIRREAEIKDLDVKPWSSNYYMSFDTNLVSNKLPEFIAAIIIIYGIEGLEYYNGDIAESAHRLVQFNAMFMDGNLIQPEQLLQPITNPQIYGEPITTPQTPTPPTPQTPTPQTPIPQTPTPLPMIPTRRIPIPLPITPTRPMPQQIIPQPTIPPPTVPPVPTVRIPTNIRPFVPPPPEATQPTAFPTIMPRRPTVPAPTLPPPIPRVPSPTIIPPPLIRAPPVQLPVLDQIPALQHLEDHPQLMTYLRTQAIRYRGMNPAVLYQLIVHRGVRNSIT